MSDTSTSASCTPELQVFSNNPHCEKSGLRATAIFSLARRVVSHFALRSAERQLRSLDDRMLRDIGIDRSEIPSIVRDRTGERCGSPFAGGSAVDVFRGLS